jgi:hypothetical protein
LTFAGVLEAFSDSFFWIDEAFGRPRRAYGRGRASPLSAMTVLNNLSVEQRRKAVAIKEQIEQLEAQLGSVLGDASETLVPAKKRHQMSAAGRARIAAVARARWAKIRGQEEIPRKKRKVSAAARLRLSAAAKARWKKAKAAGKTTL